VFVIDICAYAIMSCGFDMLHYLKEVAIRSLITLCDRFERINSGISIHCEIKHSITSSFDGIILLSSSVSFFLLKRMGVRYRA
jgi:hypothetical protein